MWSSLVSGNELGDLGDAFWTFSVGFYAQSGVECELLALQDRDGLEVNLALFCLFAARQGFQLDNGAIEAMRGVALAWGGQVVAPLREARRKMKSHAQRDEVIAGLRNDVKALELAAEKAMHMALADLLVTMETERKAQADTARDAKAIAARHFAAWFEVEGVEGEAPRHSVSRLLDMAFAD